MHQIPAAAAVQEVNSMSKIICDICGTSYPETAEQCPICGTARPVDIQGIIPDDEPAEPRSGYTYVKGGRFSKANVKKRNIIIFYAIYTKKSRKYNKKRDVRGIFRASLEIFFVFLQKINKNPSFLS